MVTPEIVKTPSKWWENRIGNKTWDEPYAPFKFLFYFYVIYDVVSALNVDENNTSIGL